MNDRVENVGKSENAAPNKQKDEKDSSKSNWVTQRASCSLPKIFKDLRAQVDGDLKTRNGLRPNNSPYEFSVEENGADFSAVLTAQVDAKDVRKSVVFSLAGHAIVVRDEEGKQMFEVTVAFTDTGECKMYVNEEEREPWQVRCMALEELLFKGY